MPIVIFFLIPLILLLFTHPYSGVTMKSSHLIFIQANLNI